MVYDMLGGVTKLEAFQCYFVTKLYPPKPSPFFKIKMKMSRSNLLRSRLAFLKTFHIGNSNPRGKQHAQKGLPYGGLTLVLTLDLTLAAAQQHPPGSSVLSSMQFVPR